VAAEETMNYNDVECPHCGAEQGDSWEFAREEPHVRPCDECGLGIKCWTVVSTTYYACAAEEDGGVE
jgi:predicted RNA-binding Zn-ribbon protein involved in translation (DUF1610 family)